LGNETTQQAQQTFAHANLLQTCHGENAVIGFGLKLAQAFERKPSELFLSVKETQPGPRLG